MTSETDKGELELSCLRGQVQKHNPPSPINREPAQGDDLVVQLSNPRFQRGLAGHIAEFLNVLARGSSNDDRSQERQTFSKVPTLGIAASTVHGLGAKARKWMRASVL